ncbi:FkbM family methyltransferase [soil metagenome]
MPADNTMVSYSQNFEDVVLARVFADVVRGCYVDVGANHPERDSVTKYFSDCGWTGINVEPGRVYATLAAARPHDINLNIVASDHSGSITYYEGDAPGLAGVLPEVPESLRLIVGERTARVVPARTLAEILATHLGNRTIDFLSVDVEGHERAVLAGNDWQRFRPRVVLVEATLPGTPTPCHDQWEDLLLTANYHFAYFDGLNRFYTRAEEAALLQPRFGPPSVFDRFIPAELAKLRAGSPDIAAATKELTMERDYLARQVRELNTQLATATSLTAGMGGRSLKLARLLSRVGRKLRPAA